MCQGGERHLQCFCGEFDSLSVHFKKFITQKISQIVQKLLKIIVITSEMSLMPKENKKILVAKIPSRSELLDGAVESEVIIKINEQMRSEEQAKNIEDISAKVASVWNILAMQTVGKETY